MDKRIILLAKSRKMNNYCIAGICPLTGDWVRIISNDSSIQYAVPESKLLYPDGTVPQIYDIIKIKCRKHLPSKHQPENYLYDASITWEKIGEIQNIGELLRIRPLEKDEQFLFFNGDKKISIEEYEQISSNRKKSLICIWPQNITINVKTWDKKKITASFNYNGIRYCYLPITDPPIEKEYLQKPDGQYPIHNNCLFVVSLGDEYEGYYYKLIASIIR